MSRTTISAVRTLVITAALLTACGEGTAPTVDPPAPPPLPPAAPTVATMFELLGGYRLAVDHASDGLAVVPDAQGFAKALVAGANAQTHSVHLYDALPTFGAGANSATWPILRPTRTWPVTTLFPRWMAQQTLRDLTVVPVTDGVELAGMGRVFYHTAPRPVTQLNIRQLRGSDYALGATREVAVDLPEQEFTGFIKHLDRPANDLAAIGGGAYDSGQGSVAGLSYAVSGADGRWTRRLAPPLFGDLAAPRLPRDTAYSCPDGPSWVCLPPANGRGIWSTERIGGGGVRLGNTLVFLPVLGYGPRMYARQTSTFGDPALDRAVAYFFTEDPATGAVTLAAYDRWTFAPPGVPVIGVALGRVRGIAEPVLFVATSMAWTQEGGSSPASAVVQLFRVRGAR